MIQNIKRADTRSINDPIVGSFSMLYVLWKKDMGINAQLSMIKHCNSHMTIQMQNLPYHLMTSINATSVFQMTDCVGSIKNQ